LEELDLRYLFEELKSQPSMQHLQEPVAALKGLLTTFTGATVLALCLGPEYTQKNKELKTSP